MMMTSAYANKLVKRLQEDKEYWMKKESEGCTYVAALGEEPIIPEYDFLTNKAQLDEIDKKILIIKHAVNVVNATSKIPVGQEEMSVDSILIRMAQLSKRKSVLDIMRKSEPKTRISFGAYSPKNVLAEYRYTNYDLDLVKQEYEKVDLLIAEMQIALDKFNQTYEFAVEI